MRRTDVDLDPRDGGGEPPRAVVAALARAMNARDALMHQHAQRVQRYAAALTIEAGLDEGRLMEAIDTAALLHDIGKLGVPEELLQKPGPLAPDEYDQVKQHAAIGAEILSANGFSRPLVLIVRHHHENWDGTGYPDGLRNEAIPIGARLLAIVDCYDALTSDRPYRRALSHDTAVGMIVQCRGTMYDPAIADAFLKFIHRVQPVPVMARIGDALRELRPSIERTAV